MPDKYQKKLLSIWKSFDPNDLNSKNELNQFIRQFHPSVEEIKSKVNDVIDGYTKALIYFRNKHLKNKLLNFIIWEKGKSWEMEDFNSLDPNEKEYILLWMKEDIDKELTRNLYGFEINPYSPITPLKLLFTFGYIKIYESIGKFLENLWEAKWGVQGTQGRFPVDDGWFNTYKGKNFEKFKDLIWKDYLIDDGLKQKYINGLKTEQLIRLNNFVSELPSDFKKELEKRLIEAEKIRKIFIKQDDEYMDRELELHKKFFKSKDYSNLIDKSLKAEGMIQPVFNHSLCPVKNKTWDRKFLTEDLWKDLNLYEIYKKNDKDFNQGKVNQFEEWFKE